MWCLCTRRGQADLGSCVYVISFTSSDLTHPSQTFPKLFVKPFSSLIPASLLIFPTAWDRFLGYLELQIGSTVRFLTASLYSRQDSGYLRAEAVFLFIISNLPALYPQSSTLEVQEEIGLRQSPAGFLPGIQRVGTELSHRGLA